MKTLFPASFAFAFFLMVIQTYLLIYFSLLVLRQLKLLKRPYGGMDYSESLPAAIILLGVLVISSSDSAGIFQAARFYGDTNNAIGESLFLFFARSFLIVFFFSAVFVILNFLNIRFLFRRHFQEPVLPVSMILCAITAGMAIICWFSCKEIIDNMTPRLINFQ